MYNCSKINLSSAFIPAQAALYESKKMRNLLLIVLITFPLLVFSDENVEKFAEDLRRLVSVRDEQGLKELPCYPQQDQCVDKAALEYIFHSEKSGVFSILNNTAVKIKIFGPHTYEDSLPNQSFTIVYYIPDLVFFNQEGILKGEQVTKQWNKGYAETVVNLINGKIYLNRTIFFYGAHLPWVDDYG